jgi:hypothetical protein
VAVNDVEVSRERIAVIASEAKQSSRARSAPNKSAVGGELSAFCKRACRRALECFAIGGAKRRRSSNGYGSQ